MSGRRRGGAFAAYAAAYPPAVGELIFNNMNMMVIEFVKREEARIPELRAAIRRQNRILVAAIGV